MFLKASIIVLLLSLLMWYLHEKHTAQFMAVTRNIPLLTPLMVQIHSYLGSSTKDKKIVPPGLFTSEQLGLYRGDTGSQGLYICILGKVFDVESGKHHYEPGGSYHVFAGQDASRAFITGEFENDKASDDVLDLAYGDILSLRQWQEFYESEYIYRGKLIGRYYTETGEKTDYHKRLDEKIKDAKADKEDKDVSKRIFPACNVEWSASTGSRVWCSQRSGGIDREWEGVPRKYYQVGSDKHKCVCIEVSQLIDPEAPQYSARNNLEVYEGCDVESTSCYVLENK